MPSKGVLIAFFLALGVEVYSQSSNTPDLKQTGTSVCSDSQSVSDWILEAPSRLKHNEPPLNKTAENAVHGHEDGKPRRRIVLMKFRGRRRRRARASKIEPESEYKLDLVNKFVKNAEVLFIAHYPNRSHCGMGTFSSYEGSPTNKTDNIKRKDDCFWSIESSLQVKHKQYFKYITPRCGCFNFSYYVAYKPGDETVIERPDPSSADPFKKLSRTYCISDEEKLKGLKKHKKKKHRKNARKNRRKINKLKKILSRSRKDVGLIAVNHAPLLYSEYAPYDNQFPYEDFDSVGIEIQNENEVNDSENAIKHYEYFSSGGFIDNSQDDEHDDNIEEGEDEEQEDDEDERISKEGSEENEVEEEEEENVEEEERNELDAGLNNDESGETSEEYEGEKKDELEVKLNKDESEESSEEKVEKENSRSNKEESGTDEEDGEINKIAVNEKSSGENEDESSEEKKEDKKGEYENEKKESCESDESEEESDESPKVRETNENYIGITEGSYGNIESKSKADSSEEENDNSGEDTKGNKIVDRRFDKRIRNKGERMRLFQLRSDENRRRRIFSQRQQRQKHNRPSFKATQVCCNQGIFRKKFILHNTLEGILDEFTETCEDIPPVMSRIAHRFLVSEEFCSYRFRQCCHEWSLVSPKMRRYPHMRHHPRHPFH